MLKLNTLLTAVSVVLMAVLGFIGKNALEKIDLQATTLSKVEVKLDAISLLTQSHETRIQTLHDDVIILQHPWRTDPDNAHLASPKQKGQTP